MRILLLHPEDTPERGDWAGQRWDCVIDLGRAGPEAYERWGALFGCVTEPLAILGLEQTRNIGTLVATGLGRVVDQEGLDWWELNVMFFHLRLEELVVLVAFANRLGADDRVFVTRPGFHANALRLLIGDRLKCFSGPTTGRRQRLNHYSRLWSRFPLPQIFEILGDKYDAAYSIRRRFAPKRRPSLRPVVLLPSAYVNVSGTGIAYAKTSPETEFLLVTTRRSASVTNPPPNVSQAELASYASPCRETEVEYGSLLRKWQTLRRDLESLPEFQLLGRLGTFDSFPRLLRQGLGIRDAWLAVLEMEPVRAVLCADDSNPYTHIPLLLARGRGIPTIVCHHGALDGRYLFKQNHADVILAKGRMEEDYLMRVCGVPPNCVEVGAPAREPSSPIVCGRAGAEASLIVFFSEAYEIAGGRGEEFYRELLPPLADLALTTGRRFVIKLHPAESRREREQLIGKVLSAERRKVAEVASGPLTDELLCRAWFGITIRSTVVTECALLGTPCFLCEWLEYGPYGYVEQFTRFGAGYGLKSPAEIGEIPRILKRWVARPETAWDLWQAIAPGRFKELLSGRRILEPVAV